MPEIITVNAEDLKPGDILEEGRTVVKVHNHYRESRCGCGWTDVTVDLTDGTLVKGKPKIVEARQYEWDDEVKAVRGVPAEVNTRT